MPLSWNEIKDRALKFSKKWAEESSEDAEAKSFMDDFIDGFGVYHKLVVTFDLCHYSAPSTFESKSEVYLFELYEKYTSGFFGVEIPKLKKI